MTIQRCMQLLSQQSTHMPPGVCAFKLLRPLNSRTTKHQTYRLQGIYDPSRKFDIEHVHVLALRWVSHQHIDPQETMKRPNHPLWAFDTGKNLYFWHDTVNNVYIYQDGTRVDPKTGATITSESQQVENQRATRRDMAIGTGRR